jgi:hypothetical protein
MCFNATHFFLTGRLTLRLMPLTKTQLPGFGGNKELHVIIAAGPCLVVIMMCITARDVPDILREEIQKCIL